MEHETPTAMTLADEPDTLARGVEPGRSRPEDGWDIVTRFS
jgi:hypothetical protein